MLVPMIHSAAVTTPVSAFPINPYSVQTDRGGYTGAPICNFTKFISGLMLC
jgi:hypothetical protein